MDLQDFLEDFGSVAQISVVSELQPTSGISESELEGQKLEAFEKGYRAGWDDAVNAQSDDQTQISSALGQHLQDLSFTYHEAYGQMTAAITPLLQEVVTSVLPEIARGTLGQHIVQQLEKLSAEIGKATVELAVAPSVVPVVEPLLEQDFGFPLSVVPDDTLALEQADIRFEEHERQIDLGDLILSVSEAVEGFAHENQRKLSHG